MYINILTLAKLKYSIRILSIIFFTLIFNYVSGQKIKGAVFGGVNITQIDGDEIYGYNKFGFNAGAAAIIPLKKNWSVSLETIYNQKGSKQKQSYSADSLTGEYKLKLNYLEVPVLVHYTDKDIITAGAGFSWGRLVKAKEEEHSGNQTPYTDIVGFNKDDINVLVDLRLRVYKRLRFNIRFAYSVAKIRTRKYDPYPGFMKSWVRDQYNNLFTFRLYYIFNEKPKIANDPSKTIK